MGGAVSELAGAGRERRSRKRKQFHTVELKVRMDCDGCELKVRNTLATMKGVESVDINRKQQKVTVQGFVEPQRVLRRAQSTGKRTELWPYVPYTNPYVAPPSYDKRAPPGHVRRVDSLIAPAGGQEESLATLFSDDNPNACSLM
ncbi:heavy metal-associated isoprenylated plant protein 23-like [Phragmites australis]|uniref:heavy metal-associated isoprenylated plant protein 23-like n=1 Tax=Phragmites australis TaxID=29695 RepID=UPI002D77A69C|nr:heavy metal-associated isoprenylated plant protein 23-like [Phragmites australis]XP_062192220.1 heavy metal-associated isoprenylated plant protein 23-like [Phragmites australis]